MKIFRSVLESVKNTQVSSIDTVFPDTAEGAKHALHTVCDETIKAFFENATWEKDPYNDGIWQGTKGRYRVIVYMAGYKDAFGRKRETSDFETNYED